MCILCVIQKWSRRIATMLPWLVIPLIGLWALSQLLPPAFRFEITSPRLACLLVLLVTLFWYEVLMPQLSAWRVRRNARLRERKRSEAIEMQKLRKTATRRCRNCLTAYRDQNPGGGKFMCSYCGHISKRPVLDLPVPPGIGNSGILKDLVCKGGKIWNGKAWSENGWICGQDWLENGNWVGGSFSGMSNWKRDGGGLFGGDDGHCLAEKSYSHVFIFACKALTAFLLRIMWFWRKIFRFGSSSNDTSSDSEHGGLMDNRSENGGNGQESRGEKARRKAEEKRQARLEKELLEEEERKQREEVARLVEERRRLRDEKMEAEKDRGKGSPHAKERDSRKEAEGKRHDKKKGKDRGSSKSNSDAEELEKRIGKESDQNKRSDSDRREQHRSTPEGMKTHGSELGNGFKGAAASNHNRGNAGTRYFDRMRGTFLSSSRAFTGGGFFGKNTNSASVSREQKPSSLLENAQTLTPRKEIVQPDKASGRQTVNGDDRSSNRPVLIEPQPCTAPKKSWQQLFTRSPAVVHPSNSSVISKPTGKHKAEVQCTPFSGQPTSTQSFDNPFGFGLQSPFSFPSFAFGSSNSSTVLPLSSEAMLPNKGVSPHQFLPEESEIFEDPCYVPDPISLLGPVSESLDSFQLDLGFVTNSGLEKPCAVKTKTPPSEATKPSPIESPLSRSRVLEGSSNSFNDNGTWQMWNSSPLVQDGLGLVGGPANWLLHPEMHLSNKDDNMHQVPHKTMASLFKKDEQASSGSHPLQRVLYGNPQSGGTINTSGSAIADGPWFPRTLFSPTSNPDNQAVLKHKGETVQNFGPAVNHQFDLSAANSWTRKECSVAGSGESVGSLGMNRAHIGGLYSPPDVQSVWSYE